MLRASSFVPRLPMVPAFLELPMDMLKSALFPRYSTVLGRSHTLITLTMMYLATLLLIRRFLGNKRSSNTTTSTFAYASALHNISLCLVSLWMFVMALRRMVEVWGKHGAVATICEGGRRYDDLFTLFLASKFWEYADTVILSLRGRPLSFLHVWHHSSVPWEVRAWIEDDVPMGIWGMLFNSGVHVFMYAYYACTALKVPFPFKRAITQLQIVQFITSFAFFLPYLYYNAHMPEGCSGKRGLMLSYFFNGSFLLLFLRFYLRTYKCKSVKV